MKLKLILFLLFLCHYSSAQTNPKLQLSELQGTWFVKMTNFPMWLKGNKTKPQINYSLVQKNGKNYLLDKVNFEKKGKQKSIIGYDESINENNTQFVWRGKGILKILKSEWEIVHFNRQQEWMLIAFKKTLFTPKGYDILSHQKSLSIAAQQEIEKVLAQLNASPDLRLISQD